MPDHMVVAAFTNEPDAALLPAERERVRELSDGGVLQAAYLSADRSEAWLVIRGDDSDATRNVMESMPLYPYLEIRGIDEVNSIAPPNG